MQQMWSRIVVGTILVIGTVFDIRKRRLPALFLMGAGVLGLGFFLKNGTLWKEHMLGLGLGIFLLAYGFLTKEQIGYGDGIILAITGFFLKNRENIFLFSMALFFAACFSILLFLKKRVNKNTRLPFLPFLLAAYGLLLCRMIPA